ncbi:MAG: HDOD domain-containing protein [Candidatus Delongbacteria bacterium]|nr:HDOD domain-containing protein [Candidatus Cloacimonadota bacterium]MCB9475061.1 HDOD domain-containing protein [Candidatus Delongbacteria bacterium]
MSEFTTPEEVVRSVSQVATLPEMHLRLLEVMNNPRSSALDMARVISRDPGLTARLLKRSNSAYYGMGSTVATVTRAITVVGVSQLRELSVSTSVVRMFKRLPQDLLDMDAFWQHSVLVGVIAKEMALMLKLPDTEEAFVAGLLHDVGRVLLVLAMPVEYRKVLLFARASGRWLNQVEHDQLGFTHAQVGGALFRSWGLPRSLEHAAEFHHFPELVTRQRTVTSMVHLADAMAHGLEIGNSGETRIPPFQSRFWEELQLPDLMTEVLANAEHSVVDVYRSIMQPASGEEEETV